MQVIYVDVVSEDQGVVMIQCRQEVSDLCAEREVMARNVEYRNNDVPLVLCFFLLRKHKDQGNEEIG